MDVQRRGFICLFLAHHNIKRVLREVTELIDGSFFRCSADLVPCTGDALHLQGQLEQQVGMVSLMHPAPAPAASETILSCNLIQILSHLAYLKPYPSPKQLKVNVRRASKFIYLKELFNFS